MPLTLGLLSKLSFLFVGSLIRVDAHVAERVHSCALRRALR
jgi:hypothetical protein